MGLTIEDFTNHSGGADGADKTWDEIGRKHGFVNHIHWRPEHLNNLTPEGHQSMLEAYINTAKALHRPELFKGTALCQRNWIPTHHAESIYAISYILAPGQKDTLGRENKAPKEVVAGGTGWAVEMAIQMGKPVYVYDMGREGTENWYIWNKDEGRFWPTFTPILTEIYSGIGARSLTPAGKRAIEETYKHTIVRCLTPETQKPKGL